MAKRLRNVALLGGAALLASKMLGRKKDETPRTESKEDVERDRRESAIAGPLRALASAPTVESKDEPKKAAPARRAPAEAPGISMEEGRAAIGLPREARGRGAGVMEGASASGMPREARGIGVMEGATASGLPREARGVTRGDVPGSQVYAQINADRIARQRRAAEEERFMSGGMKKGGVVKSSASKRADGIATKGKTRGRMI